jgi:ketosteroid isomerase-like protein
VEANSDIVSQAYEAWNRADWDFVVAQLDPAVELDATDRVFNPMEYRGPDGFLRFMQEVFEVWEEWRMEVDELIEADDRVFAGVRARARGRVSGLELDEIAYHVWSFGPGGVTRVAFHYDRDKALAAAGAAVAD